LAWAAVAPEEHIVALGIDAEPAVALPHEVRTRVLQEEEAARLAETTGLDTVGFGAKECIHKAVHPGTGIWLDFHDVLIVPTGAPSVLRAEPASPDLPHGALRLVKRLEIRWAIQDGLVFTSAWASAP
jgi:4'-phosphopantetheinyl transferase EntD